MKIGDFGMSRQLAASGPGSPSEACQSALERTLTPGTIGTAAYCSPEVRPRDSGVRTYRALGWEARHSQPARAAAGLRACS